jgi:hypothetical protein
MPFATAGTRRRENVTATAASVIAFPIAIMVIL